MEEQLQEIKTLPNIMGSFIYIEELGIAATDLPRVMRSKDLETIGRSIHRIFALNQQSGVDVVSIDIDYDEARIFTKQIDSGSTILIIGEPSANMALVKMTSSMLTAELQVAVESARLASTLPVAAPSQIEEPLLPQDQEPLTLPSEVSDTEPSAPAAESAAPANLAIDLEALLTTGELAEPLAKMQDALARAIGPFAKIIMRENLEKWTKGGAANRERLSDLADLLAVEIGNSKLEIQFRSEIRPFIA
ncbi:MAG: hypothetical protein A2511_11555 [Deltaproteobacteria bacterium RIFOXYD12_FULL_50_9]|nr:MAG: hypothetical protein A2511_11555 [Deltaproteobacteria bacterium RIFOXYD12_FULL_50_9]